MSSYVPTSKVNFAFISWIPWDWRISFELGRIQLILGQNQQKIKKRGLVSYTSDLGDYLTYADLTLAELTVCLKNYKCFEEEKITMQN